MSLEVGREPISSPVGSRAREDLVDDPVGSSWSKIFATQKAVPPPEGIVVVVGFGGAVVEVVDPGEVVAVVGEVVGVVDDVEVEDPDGDTGVVLVPPLELSVFGFAVTMADQVHHASFRPFPHT